MPEELLCSIDAVMSPCHFSEHFYCKVLHLKALGQTSRYQMLEVQANLDLEFYDLQSGLDSLRSNDDL